MDDLKLYAYYKVLWQLPGGIVNEDLVLSMLWLGSLLWHGFDPWAGNFKIKKTKQKKTKKKKTKKKQKKQKTFVITEVLHFLVTAPSVFDKAVKKSIIYIRQSLNILF